MLLALLPVLAFIQGGAQAATTIVRGPYLQLATPVSVVIRWRTDMTETSVVSYGLASDQLTMVARGAGITTEHTVQLANLKPDTRYFYKVGNVPVVQPGSAGGPAISPTYCPISSFVTPPEAGAAKPTRIWVLGDAGSASAIQRAVRDSYYAFTADYPTDLWLMLGDNAYPQGTDAESQRAIFDLYPETLRTAPVWPTLGNHDANNANSITQSGVYYDIFTLPTRAQAGGIMSGTEAYYSFDHANIHFICLDSQDSDRSTDGAMMQWLKSDLAATRQDWIIAFFHHPIYSKGTHDSDDERDSGGRMRDMREVFLPVLEAGGVDLILTGHSHVYERSRLIAGHYGKSDTYDAAVHMKQTGDGRPDGDGAYRKLHTRGKRSGHVSVVTGSAGNASRDPGPLNHPVFCFSLNEAGSSVIDVDGLKLDFIFLNDKGEKRDWFSIVKE